MFEILYLLQYFMITVLLPTMEHTTTAVFTQGKLLFSFFFLSNLKQNFLIDDTLNNVDKMYERSLSFLKLSFVHFSIWPFLFY